MIFVSLSEITVEDLVIRPLLIYKTKYICDLEHLQKVD